jgi:hypothetical protein
VLEIVEEAAVGIAAGGLPAPDHRAGVVIELARKVGIETKPVQPPLHVLALALVEADLVFRDLVRLRGKGRAGSMPVVKLRVVVDGLFSIDAIRASASDLNWPLG